MQAGRHPFLLSVVNNMKTDIDPTKLLTTVELAAMLKVSKKVVYSLATQRRIRFYKLGRGLRFDKNDVMAYLQENRVDAINY